MHSRGSFNAWSAVVPLYFFEVNDVPDSAGIDLDGADAARAEARRLLSMLIKGTDVGPGECKSWSCVIHDADGRMIQRVVLATLVEDFDDLPNGTRRFQPV